MPDYLIYDPEANEIVGNPTISEDQLPANLAGGRLVAFELDGEYRKVTIGVGRLNATFDLDTVKRPLMAKIDRAAREIREAVTSADPEQAAIYRAKAREARQTKGPRPYLDAEAQAKGIPVADLVKQVRAKADHADAVKIRTEAKRTASKGAIAAAELFPDIYSASQVDWEA